MPLLLLVILLLVLAAPASAQAPGETANPSIDQYRESVPTSQGPHYTGARKREKPAELPRGVRDRLEREAGSDAAALGAVATSPELGAPAQPQGDDSAAGGDDRRERRVERRKREGGSSEPAGEEPSPGAVSSAVDATVEGDSSGTLLLALVGVVAAVGVGGAMRRRRARVS